MAQAVDELLRRADYDDLAAEVKVVIVNITAATAPPTASNNTASAPPLIPPSSSLSGVGVPAVALSPAAICFKEPPVRSWASPDSVAIVVRPRVALTVKEVG